jgi:quinol-cytochrome oxidoreductase complex cytochrome b subunit
MLRRFVVNNIMLVSLVLFLILFAIILIYKPTLMFDKNGKPREFGIGYKNKTILPLWLMVIILAIITYFSILCYVNYNKYM